jgi:acetyl-CoA carboxylase biotin carboxyl carrier protein
MDLQKIRELVQLVDQSNLTAFELEEEGFRIVLKKEAGAAFVKETFAGFPAEKQDLPEKTGLGSGVVQEALKEPEQPPTINSPIVGTFYGSAAPGEEPFVRPGSKVRQGDVLCIIEAMKLMNEIEADEDFEIIDVLVQDGQMVEYGQPLFSISKK